MSIKCSLIGDLEVIAAENEPWHEYKGAWSTHDSSPSTVLVSALQQKSLPPAHTFLSELLFKLSLGFLCYLFLSLVKDNKIMCLDHILVSKYQYKFLKNQLKKQLLQIPTGSFSDIYYLQYLLNYYTRQLFICVILSY